MRFTIVGSGGCCALPRPGCFCRICKEAREKGAPYARFGPALYCHEAKTLVDTPEDITPALNHSRVPEVDRVVYTHPDPDHTMGMRVFEQLRLDWEAAARGVKPGNPIGVYALPGCREILMKAGAGYGSSLEYYGQMGLIEMKEEEQFSEGGVRVSLVRTPENARVAAVLFEEGGKKLVYAPCDCRPFPQDEQLKNADVLVLGNTIHGSKWKTEQPIGFYAERFGLFTREEAAALAREMGAKQLVFTHLEEDWGLSHDEYRALEDGYIRFAFDGMEIEV
ncbi:MAG: MBL fold metallo-hydrolase [Eubacteriales bacterium]|nr:MBL fold metallo-hydrolase [Eubacteriales bacterium]